MVTCTLFPLCWRLRHEIYNWSILKWSSETIYQESWDCRDGTSSEFNGDIQESKRTLDVFRCKASKSSGTCSTAILSFWLSVDGWHIWPQVSTGFLSISWGALLPHWAKLLATKCKNGEWQHLEYAWIQPELLKELLKQKGKANENHYPVLLSQNHQTLAASTAVRFVQFVGLGWGRMLTFTWNSKPT